MKLEEDSILDHSAKDEFGNPLDRRELDSRTIYLSRNEYGPLLHKTGIIQIVDFDQSVPFEPGQVHEGYMGVEIYRAPEVILDAGWSYPAEIWSLGASKDLSPSMRQG